MAWPTMAQIEREAILDSLRHCRGDVSEAARVLGISRGKMYRKLKKYGVTFTKRNRDVITS